jgi:hypothetical protein
MDVRERLRDGAPVLAGQGRQESCRYAAAAACGRLLSFPGHDQRTGLVIDIGADSAQGGEAGPVVVTAQQQIRWMRVPRPAGDNHCDYWSGEAVRASGTAGTISGGQDQRLLMLMARRGSVTLCRRRSARQDR